MNKVTKIFWTGGWDSTFRMLQLLIIEKKPVQPFYIVRIQKSVGHEIKAIHDVRRQIFRRFPETKELLMPMRYYDVLDILENNHISKLVQQLRKEGVRVADQYDFLARFCEQNEIDDIELCAEKVVSDPGTIVPRIYSLLENGRWGEKIDFNEKDQKWYEIFKYYKFPLIETTRKGMTEIVYRNGFEDIMNLTWFCATPVGSRPCGFCSPCTHLVQEGFGRRIPFFRRIASKIHMPFRRLLRSYKMSSNRI